MKVRGRARHVRGRVGRRECLAVESSITRPSASSPRMGSIRCQDSKECPMIVDVTCRTDRFNLTVVGPDFINDGCYGEDFSRWLVSALSEAGVPADVICMEDFGWANQAGVSVRSRSSGVQARVGRHATSHVRMGGDAMPVKADCPLLPSSSMSESAWSRAIIRWRETSVLVAPRHRGVASGRDHAGGD